MSEKIYNMVDLETIEKLADLVSEKHLEEITIADGEKTITVKGKKCPPPPPREGMPPMGMPPMGMPPVNAPVGAPAPAATPAATLAAPAASSTGKAIKSPIVGTFYSAPSPDQPPFVKVGDTVKKGDVVLIIESMKLMNEVTSDIDGVVQEILVKNGDAVEYDQPLIILS